MNLKRKSSLLPLLFGVIFFLTFETGDASKNRRIKKFYCESGSECEEFSFCDDSCASQNGNAKDEDTSQGENIILYTDSDTTQNRDNIVNFEDTDGEKMLYDESIKSKSCDDNGKIYDIDIDEIYSEKIDKNFTLYDDEIFINDFKNYEPWYEEESKSPVQNRAYRLLDIGSEIANLGNLKKVDPKLVKRIMKTLQKDLNDFLCENQAARLPYGKVFTFQDADDSKWVGLVATGARKSWKLLIDGAEIDGDVWIGKSDTDEYEIIFRRRKIHTKLTKDDWIYITPKYQTVIKKIKSFKKYTQLNSEGLQKFKRAACFEEDGSEWEFKGFYDIESDKTIYDESSTLYKIKWNDQSAWDTLKDESDLAGDLEIGDVICYESEYGRGFGDVKERVKVLCDNRVASGVSPFYFNYKVLPVEWREDDLNQEELLLTSDKITYLWEKRKPTEESNVTHVAEDFTEEFFEQIADLLKADDTCIYKRIIDHVSNEEKLYMGAHPKEFLTSEEIDEVVRWARGNRDGNEGVKKQILNSWKKQMKGKKRRADNLSVIAAQKIWKDKIKIKVLGSGKYEPRAHFSISLLDKKKIDTNQEKEKLNKTQSEEQKSNETGCEKQKSKETEIVETSDAESKSQETNEDRHKRKRLHKNYGNAPNDGKQM